MNHDLKEVARILEEYIRPQTHPLAVKMAVAGEELPPKTKMPLRDLKQHLAVCQCFNMARRYGWTMAVGREDQSCPIGSMILGFEQAVPYYTEGNLAEGMYTQTKKAGIRSEEEISRFAFKKYEYLLIAPIKQTDFTPDFLYIYCNAAQLMRLVHGALYVGGGSLTSSFTGRGECSQTIVDTIESDRCQVILPGNGERVFGQTQDHEMAFTIPGSQIENVMTGLVETHKKGVRYPIPSMLNYEVTYPPKYMELKKFWCTED